MVLPADSVGLDGDDGGDGSRRSNHRWNPSYPRSNPNFRRWNPSFRRWNPSFRRLNPNYRRWNPSFRHCFPNANGDANRLGPVGRIGRPRSR